MLLLPLRRFGCCFFATTVLLLTWIAATAKTAFVHALNGDPSKLGLDTYLGWKAFEVITQGDTNGNGYTLPGELDGIGAYLEDDDTLRVLVNHETGRACDTENLSIVTQIDLDLSNLQQAIQNMRNDGNLGGERSFVRSFGPSWDVIIDENGDEVSSLPSRFRLFCSSQAYGPDTFGPDEGFADQIYIFGEEKKNMPYGRLFAIDSSTRTLYQLSGAIGDASSSQGGNPGMVYDSFENIALIRTFETNHVAFLVSVDGGTKKLKLYVGQKGKGKNGEPDNEEFLARNGLAYGSWFYLSGSLPTERGQTVSNGFFSAIENGALTAEKFEDVDTNPLIPTQVVLGEEQLGVFVFDFVLDFSSNGIFQSGSGGSSFSLTMIVNQDDGPVKQADNVLWTAADLIYVCSDGANGAVWQFESDGSDIVKVASSKMTDPDQNPSAAVDISQYVGYEPASILLVDNMGCGSSMAVLINPDARLLPAPEPTDMPNPEPTDMPNPEPSGKPNPEPTAMPNPEPTAMPNPEPTNMPNPEPTNMPNPEPTDRPNSEPIVIAFGCPANPCDAVFGLPFLGNGEQIHTDLLWCNNLCMFKEFAFIFVWLGWTCGTCSGEL